MKMLNVGELKYIFLCLCLFFVFLFSFYFIWKNTFYLSFLGKFTKTEETSVSVVSNLSKQVHFLVHTRVWYKSVVFLIDQVLLIITNQGAAVQLKCLQQFEDEFIVLFSNHPPSEIALLIRIGFQVNVLQIWFISPLCSLFVKGQKIKDKVNNLFFKFPCFLYHCWTVPYLPHNIHVNIISTHI